MCFDMKILQKLVYCHFSLSRVCQEALSGMFGELGFLSLPSFSGWRDSMLLFRLEVCYCDLICE
jgi:hypothetical protein